MSKNRILWVDTMKAIGMFFIVLGHFFPLYISAWIYTFNVPLFFFMSGFLARKENSWTIFLRKNLQGLIVPYLLLCVLISVQYIISNISDWHRMSYWLVGVLFGFHSIDGMAGCQSMWFVYCLFLVKVLFQLSATDKRRWALLVVCVLGMIVYHIYGIKLKWAFSNVLYAFPYFMMGYWFKQKDIVKFVTLKLHDWRWNTVVGTSSILTAVVASYNGIAMTYEGGVGNSLIIMALCSIVNIMAICRLSYAIQNFRVKEVSAISSGSILILAFHWRIVCIIGRLVGHFLKGYPAIECFAFAVFALCICIVFIPIIRFIHQQLPILMGRR